MPKSEPKPSDAARFLSAMKQIVSVPKAEIERRHKVWQKQRKAVKQLRDAKV